MNREKLKERIAVIITRARYIDYQEVIAEEIAERILQVLEEKDENNTKPLGNIKHPFKTPRIRP